MPQSLVVITGATSGIGMQTAIRFNEAGYPLLLIGRNTQALDALQLNNTMIRAVDVTNRNEIEAAIREAEAQYGPTDALLNIAGVMLLGDVATQNPKEWQTMFDVNVVAILNSTQIVLPSMRERNTGTIMNVSSIAGIKPFPNHAAYVGSKFAVHGLTDNIREEAAPYNVRVITIAPGAVETPLLSHTNSDQIKADYAAWKQDMGGVLAADDVARAMLYAYQQPQSVCIREIVLATTKQQP